MSLTHAFVSTKEDSADATKLRPSDWNADHVFAGGALGSLMYRDTGSANGFSWLDDVAVGSVLVSGGVGVAPAWSASLTLAGSLTLPNGSAAAPALVLGTNTGFFYSGASPKLSVGGTQLYTFGATSFVLENNITGILFRNNSAVLSMGVDDDLVIGREAAAVFRLGANAAGVINQTLKGPNRITSDGVGGNLTIAGGKNRGAFAGGSLIFQTSPAAGAGVTGTSTTRLTIDSTGLVTLGTQPAYVSGDKYMVIDSSGNIHVSATGPGS